MKTIKNCHSPSGMGFSMAGASLTTLTDCPSCLYGTLDRKEDRLVCADCHSVFTLNGGDVPPEYRKSKNGDTLAELNQRREEVGKRLSEAYTKLRVAEQSIIPLKESVASLESEQANISCRINIWKSEYP